MLVFEALWWHVGDGACIYLVGLERCANAADAEVDYLDE